MSETELDRRTFIKGAGATAAAAAGGATLHSPRLSPVGQSEAIPVIPLAVGTAAAVGSTWLLEEVDIFGSDEPPDDLTADVLKEQIRRTAETRRSINQSTFVDNLNLIDGAEHLGYDTGKRAAWDAINEGDSQDDVVDAAQTAVNDYFTPLYENFLKSWNETLVEYQAMVDLVNQNEDLSDFVFGMSHVGSTSTRYRLSSEKDIIEEMESVDLPNGDTFHIHGIDDSSRGSWFNDSHHFKLLIADDPSTTSDPYGTSGDERDPEYVRSYWESEDDSAVPYAFIQEWVEVFEKLEDAYEEAHNGITLWVDDVYGDVQAGEIDPSDLLNPRDIAGMLDEDEDLARAKADLLALNIPTDLNVEAKIETTLDGYGYDVVVSGMFAATSGPSGGFEAGETYTPNEGGVGSVHMAAYSGDLAIEVPESHYDDALDGGTMTWDRSPAEGYEFYVQTNAGETATIEYDDLEPVEDDWYYGVDTYEVNLSDQLSEPIAEVEKVTGAPVDEKSVNLTLSNEFKILDITDSDGEPVHTIDPIEPTEPHSDDNYLTQEDYDQMNDDLQERFDAIEDALDDSGGISGGGAGFLDDLTDFGASTVQTIVGGLVLFILFIFGLNAASS